MKILVLASDLKQSGSLALQADFLARGLKENGIDCRICHYDLRKREREWQYETFKPDFVIGVGWWANTPEMVLEPLRYNLKPVPWFLADGWVANYQDILSRLPLVLTTSEWVKEVYKRDGVKTENFEVLHVGYDPKEFYPVSAETEQVKQIKRKLGLGQEKVILTAGGDITTKGGQEILKALAKIDWQFPNWKYVCKAFDCQRTQVHRAEEYRLIEELKINPEKIVYLSEDLYGREYMLYFLNICDIYAAPSRLEGFGMLQVEAMACGKPVVSIDAMGPKETVIHGKTGFLAKVGQETKISQAYVCEEMGYEQKKLVSFQEPKTLAFRADSDELAEYILKLFSDDSLREKMGRQAAEHAKNNFDYKKLAKRCLDILNRTFLEKQNLFSGEAVKSENISSR